MATSPAFAGLRATRAGLDINEAIVGVGRLVEHAAEFEARHFGFNRLLIGFDGDQRVFIVLATGENEQLTPIVELLPHPVKGHDDAFELFLFLAESLRAFGVVPDFRVFELPVQFFQFCGFDIVVKDTSAIRNRVAGDR